MTLELPPPPKEFIDRMRCGNCGNLLPPLDEGTDQTPIPKTMFGLPVVFICPKCQGDKE